MNYLVVCKSDNKLFLMMQPDGSGIQAYKSKEEVMGAFKGYTEAWKKDATWSTSACLGMMQMQPIAIKAPDNEGDIVNYVTEMKMYKISGGAIGRGYSGVLVSENILELKQFEIWNETMVLAGIK